MKQQLILSSKYLALAFAIICLIEVMSWLALYSLGIQALPFSKIYDPAINTSRFKGKCSDYLDAFALNPYLGYTHDQKCLDETYRINNLGLLNQDVQDPYQRTSYAVGIFGGSVASNFAGLNSVPQLETMLNACYTNKQAS